MSSSVTLSVCVCGHLSIYEHHNGKGINKLQKIRTLSLSQDQCTIEKLILELPEYLTPTAKLRGIK